MGSAPDISVIIPTRDRPDKLRQCLAALTAQETRGRSFEVVVATDGPDAVSESVCGEFDGRLDLLCFEAPRQGIASVKNHAIGASAGRLLLLINDDVIPDAGFIAAHATAHEARSDREPAMILGYSPWVVREHESVFELLVRETSMIFFYDRMIEQADAAERDWGYRHAWNLNLSVAREAVVEIGGFRPAIANCCYEDVELAWRLAGELGLPVLFRREAQAPHDHLYTPEAYLKREFRLGYSALGLAESAPDCAMDLFGRDVASAAERDMCRALLERCAGDGERLRRTFCELQNWPAASVSQGLKGQVVRMAYEHHLLLKRMEFARGLLAAHEGKRFDSFFHGPDGLPMQPQHDIVAGVDRPVAREETANLQ